VLQPTGRRPEKNKEGDDLHHRMIFQAQVQKKKIQESREVAWYGTQRENRKDAKSDGTYSRTNINRGCGRMKTRRSRRTNIR
jgi:hypothetical protein